MLIRFFIAILIAAAAASSCAEPGWEFEIDPEGWSAQKQIENLRTEGGKLKGLSTGTFPFIISPFPLNVDADERKILVIDMETSDQFNNTMVFWRTSYYNQFNMAQSSPVSLGSRGRFHRYYLNLGRHPRWEGIVQQLLIVPQAAPGEFAVKSIALERSNPVNLFLAAWQEFTAYETVKGSTVNTIRSAMILGRRFNFYAIALLSLCLIAAFAWKLYKLEWKPGEIRASLNFALRCAAALMLVLWASLEARMYLDYGKTAALDFQTYWGRSLDEKRAAISGGDLYEYVKFVNENLPERTVVNFVGPVYFRERAAMYLYPNTFRHKEAAEYVLVYGETPDPEKYGNYETFATFREGKYIMKRRTK